MAAMLARAILGIVAGLALVSPSWAQAPPVSLPPGFHLEVFASDLGGPRFMTLDPAGTLLVSVPSRGRVVALPDKNGHGKPDAVVIVADGLSQPHGLAFKDGQLYVAETGRVLRFHYDPAALKASQPRVIVPSLPTGGHWTRTLVFGPDGRLYVSIGSSCNICRERDSRRAAIMRYRPDGSGEELFASGLRNAVGIAFHPSTGVLWATVNERDWLGDDVPPDLITEVRERGFYGFPDCFTAGGKTFVDSRVLKGDRCPPMTAPSLEIQGTAVPRRVPRQPLRGLPRLLEPLGADRLQGGAGQARRRQGHGRGGLRDGLSVRRHGLGPARGSPGGTRRRPLPLLRPVRPGHLPDHLPAPLTQRLLAGGA